MGLIIPRCETEKIKKINTWVILYGRRKTGKTYLIRNFVNPDAYYFITRSRDIFSYNKEIEKLSYNVFFDRIKRELTAEMTIAIDEFQRLPQEFLDFLHFMKNTSKAKLILVGSSLGFALKILSKGSPLLGLIYPIQLKLITPQDITSSLCGIFDDKTCILLSMFIRDPVVLEDLQEDDTLESFLERIIPKLKFTIRSLIGEIFTEEERELTARYEAVIKAVAAGNRKPSNVASFVSEMLNANLKSQDIKKYLKVLTEMGILRKIRMYKRKANYYYIDSPAVDLYYYLDLKTGFSELDVPLRTLLKRAFEKIPFYYEMFVLDILAQLYDAEVMKSHYPEIDGLLVREDKVIAAVEVKMGKISKNELNKFIDKTEDITKQRIVVAENKIDNETIVCMTPSELISKITAKRKLY